MPNTDTQIRNAKPAEKPFKQCDDGWLFLVVTPSGSKLWRMACRFERKERRLSYGQKPNISLHDASTLPLIIDLCFVMTRQTVH